MKEEESPFYETEKEMDREPGSFCSLRSCLQGGVACLSDLVASLAHYLTDEGPPINSVTSFECVGYC